MPDSNESRQRGRSRPSTSGLARSENRCAVQGPFTDWLHAAAREHFVNIAVTPLKALDHRVRVLAAMTSRASSSALHLWAQTAARRQNFPESTSPRYRESSRVFPRRSQILAFTAISAAASRRRCHYEGAAERFVRAPSSSTARSAPTAFSRCLRSVRAEPAQAGSAEGVKGDEDVDRLFADPIGGTGR